MNIHRDALVDATDEQLKAFRDNVLKHWQHIPDDGITVTRVWETIMVRLDGPGGMTVGIEPDGYTHS